MKTPIQKNKTPCHPRVKELIREALADHEMGSVAGSVARPYAGPKLRFANSEHVLRFAALAKLSAERRKVYFMREIESSVCGGPDECTVC